MHILCIRILDLKIKTYAFETEVEARNHAEKLLLATMNLYGHDVKFHYSCLEELAHICRENDIEVEYDIYKYHKYVVLQKGYAIFGSGDTPEDAFNDMKNWINSDDPMQSWTFEDINQSYHSANDAEMVLTIATVELLQQYL